MLNGIKKFLKDHEQTLKTIGGIVLTFSACVLVGTLLEKRMDAVGRDPEDTSPFPYGMSAEDIVETKFSMDRAGIPLSAGEEEDYKFALTLLQNEVKIQELINTTNC